VETSEGVDRAAQLLSGMRISKTNFCVVRGVGTDGRDELKLITLDLRLDVHLAHGRCRLKASRADTGRHV
jgi:hypothetical protein